MTKVETVNLQGKEYATVPLRLKAFREDCPRGSIKTTPHIQESGQIMFETYILKDKNDPNSADATGHSIGMAGKAKDFEKLETISVGRALALLGYLASGDIASSEEMEEFEAHQAEKWQKEVDAIETISELSAYYHENKGKGKEFDAYVTKRKTELEKKDETQSE